MWIERTFASPGFIGVAARWLLLRRAKHWRLVGRNGQHVTPAWITALGSAFWASRVLMAAVELRVFTLLGDDAVDADALAHKIKIHTRSATDFFDALVALGLLRRRRGKYSNTIDGSAFLREDSPLFIGGAIEMADKRLYGFWGRLTAGLRTGLPQNELVEGNDQFAAIYADAERLRVFAAAMTSVSVGPAARLAELVPWGEHRRVADLGTAEGIVPALLATRYAHLQCVGVDLPELEPFFQRTIAERAVGDRVAYVGADLFADAWPPADVYILGHMLHNFDLQRRRFLVERAFALLPQGGRVVIYDAMIDDARRRNVVGLLMSLNMLIETPAGSDYTIGYIQTLLRECGFKKIRVAPLFGFDWVAVARK